MEVIFGCIYKENEMTTVKKFLGFLTLFLVFSSSAIAREPVPIVNHIDVPVITTSGRPVSSDQVRDAIIRAAEAQKWEVTRSTNGDPISAKLVVRGKHTVVVWIAYSAERFSIKYQNSINMKYGLSQGSPSKGASYMDYNSPARGVAEGTPMIHPFYNDWVKELLQGIQLELKAL